MPLRLPANRQEVIDRGLSDIQAVLQNTNPFLRNSLLRALGTATGGRNFEFYFQLQSLSRDLFPLTSTDEFADGWASLKGVFRNPASIANGDLIATGVLGTVIPVGTQFSTPDGRQYVTLLASTIVTQLINIDDLSSVGVTATANTTGAHGFASGQTVTIAGATQAGYNGAFLITRIDDTTFQYDVPLGLPSPATGIITSTADMATIPSASIEFGEAQNIDGNTQLSITSPIAGLDNTAIALPPGITGGTDLESDADFRTRFIAAYQDPIAQYNVAAVTQAATSVPGGTRVFVLEVTPAIGFVTVFFMRDNDVNPIPDANEVQKVLDAITAIRPVNGNNTNLIVQAPTPITVDFLISLIDPDTPTMRDSITANLALMFAERTSVGQDLTPDDYRCAISGTVDNVTGQVLSRFILTSPTGTIAVGAGEIPVLGTITF